MLAHPFQRRDGKASRCVSSESRVRWWLSNTYRHDHLKSAPTFGNHSVAGWLGRVEAHQLSKTLVKISNLAIGVFEEDQMQRIGKMRIRFRWLVLSWRGRAAGPTFLLWYGWRRGTLRGGILQ
jgi:hypothetical protein